MTHGEHETMEKVPFQEVVGNLMYVMIVIRL
jgi:hypothetical protein